MRRNSLLSVLLLVLVLISCTNENDPQNEETPDLKQYYKDNNFDFVSRLHFYKEDLLNYSEVKIEHIADRNGKINFVASTFRNTEGIFVGQVAGEAIDLSILANSSVANTNYMSNLKYASNPYTSKVEWDFDRQSRLHYITYRTYESFFPNYFGGSFGGYYNANTGISMFSTKKIPVGYGGYCRNVSNRMLFIDMYRVKGFYENKVDSSWVEMPLSVTKSALSFDFETVDSDYGIVALTTTDSLIAYSIQGLTTKYISRIKTANNQAFAGWDGAYSVAIYKNGSNTNQPYIVIRRNSTADIYKYNITSSTLSEVHKNLPLPQILHFNNYNTFGNCDRNHYFIFHEEKVMIFTGANIYNLKEGVLDRKAHV
jgi:hypothetical protein